MEYFTDRACIVFVALVFLTKFVVFVLDPQPGLFFGDSASYIHTALTKLVPLDRSFTYGFVIRYIAVWPKSLTSLVSIQVFSSALSALLLAYALQKELSVNPLCAYLTGILCAVEPIQLVYERYVMTETLSLTIFAVYMVLALNYVKNSSLKVLCAIQVAGIILVSFRVSYLPIVLPFIVLLPVLAILYRLDKDGIVRALSRPFTLNRIAHSRVPLVVCIHLLVSICSAFILHTGYKQIYSSLLGYPSSYNAKSGAFLLGAWAPVIEPVDFPNPKLRDAVFGNLLYDLKDPNTRGIQVFWKGGLVDRVYAAAPPAEANELAQRTAFNALLRDPVGVAKLTLMNFRDFFDLKTLRRTILIDLGMDRPIEFEEIFEKYFFLAAKELPELRTLTKRLYQHAIPWYWFLLVSPLICIIAMLGAGFRKVILMVPVFTAICVTLLTATGVTVWPIVRYLHPLSWLVLLVLGVLGDRALQLATVRRSM